MEQGKNGNSPILSPYSIKGGGEEANTETNHVSSGNQLTSRSTYYCVFSFLSRQRELKLVISWLQLGESRRGLCNTKGTKLPNSYCSEDSRKEPSIIKQTGILTLAERVSFQKIQPPCLLLTIPASALTSSRKFSLGDKVPMARILLKSHKDVFLK